MNIGENKGDFLYNMLYFNMSRFDHYVINTPLLYSEGLSKISGGNVYLKCENLQKTGAYKIRGALSKISNLTPRQRKTGLVVSSSGNFGQGMAFACKIMKIKLTVFVPEITPNIKISAIRRLGAEIAIKGKLFNDTEILAKKHAKNKGKIYVSPYNDLQVLEGYGSIASEVLEVLPTFDYFLAPTGAGSIISGCGPKLREKMKRLKIIAVQSVNTPLMYNLFYRKKFREKLTLAEGLLGLEKDSVTIPLTKKYADEVILVSENDIAESIIWTLEHEHIVIEGSSAVVIASILKKKLNVSNKKAVLVISGGNLDRETLLRIYKKHNISLDSHYIP